MAALAACTTTAVDPQYDRGDGLETFQRKEERLFHVGFRLGAANAEYCENRLHSIGLLLHDAQAYAEPEAVYRAFGLTGDIAVQAVAPGSPADGAGLRQNDTIIAIDDIRISDIPASDKKWARVAGLRDGIARSASEGSVAIEWEDNRGTSSKAFVEPIISCASHFELLSGDDGAAADGVRVLVGENFPALEYAEDEFAAILAHEMAHNLLGHIAFRSELGNGGGRARTTEREADRLMPWLLANAGYDPAAASRMMRKFGPRHLGGLLRRRTHDGWDERLELIDLEIEKIAKLRAGNPGAKLDWRDHFPLATIPEND